MIVKQEGKVHLRLREPFDGETDFFFGSLAAIYERLTKDVVGISLYRLRCVFAKSGYNLDTGKAVICKAQL